MECLVCVLLLLVVAGCSGQELPDLPDYFIGSEEYNTIVHENGYTTANLVRNYFDGTVGLARSDSAAEAINPEDSGTVVSIIDVGHKVNYLIYPEYKNCTVKTLDLPLGGGGIIVNPDGTYSFGNIDQIFYIVNASQYEYMGNSSAHGIDLDNWSFTGDVDLPGDLSYRNVTLGLSIAHAGTPTIRGSNPNPVPWKLSIDGVVSTTTYNASISAVIRFFDYSFTRPNYDVFDISLCLDLKDYVVIIMSVPKGPNKMVDYSTFTANVRKSIVDYTGLAPIQVGNIQIVSIGGDELFTTLQLSNITSKATIVDTPVTAMAAYNKIALNTMNGLLPFQIDIGYGHMVTPKEIEVKYVDGNSTTPTPSATTEPIPEQSMSSFATMVPNPDSSMMPSPTTTTTTVTVTITPSACPSVPVQPPPSSANLCPTPLPPSTGKSYSRSYVTGLGFGMVILGAVVAVLVMLLGLFLCSRCKRFSLRTGYEQQVNVNEY